MGGNIMERFRDLGREALDSISKLGVEEEIVEDVTVVTCRGAEPRGSGAFMLLDATAVVMAMEELDAIPKVKFVVGLESGVCYISMRATIPQFVLQWMSYPITWGNEFEKISGNS